MEKRSYVDTGATGHVGRVVADKLKAQGHEVRAVSRSADVDLGNAEALNRAYTRRQMIGGVTMGLGSIAITITPAGAPSSADTSIHQEVDFKARPERIYEALLDEKQFSAFSGASAQIRREAGGAFKLFGGRVTGRNVELIPNQRIVQVSLPKTLSAL